MNKINKNELKHIYIYIYIYMHKSIYLDIDGEFIFARAVDVWDL